jgi:hypothetical protein
LAKEPETNEAFLREVDDELRRSELEAFWKRWGRWLIAGTVGGLALFGGYLYWQNQQALASGVEAEQLSAALDDGSEGKTDEAIKKLDGVSKSSRDGYRASAQMAKAALLLEKNDVKGAATAFGAIANDATLDQPWRDLAIVRQTATEFDTLKPETAIARLKPLAVKGHPWFGSAGEMVAMAYVKQGKVQLAGKIFSDMAKDEQVPETIRSRAVQMAAVMEAGANQPMNEVKSQ